MARSRVERRRSGTRSAGLTGLLRDADLMRELIARTQQDLLTNTLPGRDARRSRRGQSARAPDGECG